MSLEDARRRLRGKIPTGNPYVAMAYCQDMMDLAVNDLKEHPESENAMETIKYDDFTKLDLRIATITDASPVEGADKLVLLKLDIGNGESRQIVAGIKKHFPLCAESKSSLVGKQIVIVANLEPRKLRGVESHGMLLAASNGEELQLLTPEHFIAAGSKVG